MDMIESLLAIARVHLLLDPVSIFCVKSDTSDIIDTTGHTPLLYLDSDSQFGSLEMTCSTVANLFISIKLIPFIC